MLHAHPSVVSAEAFPFDPDFPQLKIASDPALMREVFRRHLKPVAGKVLRIEDCVPYRFRCRQSRARCVLQYTLRIVEPATGRESNQWVSGLVYAAPGEAEQLWHELQAADPRPEIPADWLTFEPVEFIPDLQMLVQVFPCDRKLRHLRRVMNGAAGELERLLLARLGPGRWRVEDCRLEPIRYRTELGAALRYTMRVRDGQAANSETLRAYLKVYRNERGQETFELLQSLAARAGAGRQPYASVRPVIYLNELRTLVLEEAPGTPLQQCLLQSGDAAEAVRAVARAVAAFHQDTLRITRQHSLTDQLQDVKRASTLVQWACPEVRAETQAITTAVVAGLKAVPPAPIHRDLKPDHIFLEGGRVTFIDCDSVALGDPVRDPAHLFAHLAARVGLDAMPREQARDAAAAFAEEYFSRVPKSWRERFSRHCAGALIEVADGIFRRQEPRWPRKVTACIEEAQHALSYRN